LVELKFTERVSALRVCVNLFLNVLGGKVLVVAAILCLQYRTSWDFCANFHPNLQRRLVAKLIFIAQAISTYSPSADSFARHFSQYQFKNFNKTRNSYWQSVIVTVSPLFSQRSAFFDRHALLIDK